MIYIVPYNSTGKDAAHKFRTKRLTTNETLVIMSCDLNGSRDELHSSNNHGDCFQPCIQHRDADIQQIWSGGDLTFLGVCK